MRVWRAAPEEAPVVAALLGGFRDHLGYDRPDDASLLASVERIIGRDEARGGGVGRMLVEEVLRRAAERGCARVELDVNTENPAALALYRSLGFDTGKTGGQDLLMRRRL